MLEDMQVPQHQLLPIEEIRARGGQILEFSESELFPVDQNSELVASTSSYQHLSEMAAPPLTANLSDIFFEEDENDISASIDFTSFSTPNHHREASTMYGGPERWGMAAPVVPLPLSACDYEEECFPPCFRVGSGTHAPYLGPGILMGMHQELMDNQGEGEGEAGDIADTFMPPFFNYSTQLQGMSESQHVNHGGASIVNTSLASEISSFEDATFKVGKISVEERQKKIHRYMKKRNERNFSKKIKYACRKTLADSRPRVRGRFAKNDDLMMENNHEQENEHITLYSNSMPPPRKVVVKEEEALHAYGYDHHPYAHISGVGVEVNSSFKYSNYHIESWM